MTNAMCDRTCSYCRVLDDPPMLYLRCYKHGEVAPIGKLCLDFDVSDDRKGDMNGTNNQAIKADAGKPKLTLVPSKILEAIARIREYGNNKYPDGGPDNWRDVEPERYRDAAYRHLVKYVEDPHGLDKESGLPHLWHLACNVAFLCELEDEKIKEEMNGR